MIPRGTGYVRDPAALASIVGTMQPLGQRF